MPSLSFLNEDTKLKYSTIVLAGRRLVYQLSLVTGIDWHKRVAKQYPRKNKAWV